MKSPQSILHRDASRFSVSSTTDNNLYSAKTQVVFRLLSCLLSTFSYKLVTLYAPFFTFRIKLTYKVSCFLILMFKVSVYHTDLTEGRYGPVLNKTSSG